MHLPFHFATDSADNRERVSSAIYGLMITAVSLITGAIHGGSLWHLLALTFATNLIYFLTHVFCEAIVPDPNDHATLRHHAWVSAPMITAAFSPMLVTALAYWAGLRLLDAVWVGLGWDLLGFVIAAWWGMRKRGYSRIKRLLILSVVLAIMALLVIGKLALHKG